MLHEFTNPFRYVPHPLVRAAAAQVMAELDGWRDMPEGSPERELERSFAEGKMMGVLVCKRPEGCPTDICTTGMDEALCYIAAFSGTVRGADGKVTATVEGFVPPIIDLTSPDGYFKYKEAEISNINRKISELATNARLRALKDSYQSMVAQKEDDIRAMQEQIRSSKIRREQIRRQSADATEEAGLIKESQFQKAQLKRLKDKWKETLEGICTEISSFESEISILKKERSEKSDELQKWIFENALIHNAHGEVSSIWKVFNDGGLVPPGGTGDCAAPKLLEFAFAHGLEPLAMGEFWYGLSPDTAVRTHGHFYPSCTSRCGLLLGYMMQGLRTALPEAEVTKQSPVIIHEDEAIIVLEKPSGMPSVPGLDGRKSLQEFLTERNKSEVHSVHRLDMDTSGVMVYAKTEAAALHLRKQFEEHTIRKTYIARLTGKLTESQATPRELCNTTGTIKLPLSPDYDERPRQKVDFKQGKPAQTDYKTLQTHPDGTTDILLYPLTGRTHQLRVHCAHALGLARPIAGDLLYGAYTAEDCAAVEYCSAKPTESRLGAGSTHSPEPNQPSPSRLCLHALSITFIHPLTGIPQTFTSATQSFNRNAQINQTPDTQDNAQIR